MNDKKTQFLQFSFGGGSRVDWTLFHLSLCECHCGWPVLNHLPSSDLVYPSGTCWIGTTIKEGLSTVNERGEIVDSCIVNNPWCYLRQEPGFMMGCKLPGVSQCISLSSGGIMAERDVSQADPVWGMDTEVFATTRGTSPASKSTQKHLLGLANVFKENDFASGSYFPSKTS